MSENMIGAMVLRICQPAIIKFRDVSPILFSMPAKSWVALFAWSFQDYTPRLVDFGARLTSLRRARQALSPDQEPPDWLLSHRHLPLRLGRNRSVRQTSRAAKK